MNAYQVTYQVDDGTTDTVSVPAVSHEAAQYAAFDELVDRSIRIKRFLFTQMWHEETSQWVEVPRSVPASARRWAER